MSTNKDGSKDDLTIGSVGNPSSLRIGDVTNTSHSAGESNRTAQQGPINPGPSTSAPQSSKKGSIAKKVLIGLVAVLLMRGCAWLIKPHLEDAVHEPTTVKGPLAQGLVTSMEDMYLHYLNGTHTADPMTGIEPYIKAGFLKPDPVKMKNISFYSIQKDARIFNMDIVAIGEEWNGDPSQLQENPGIVVLLEGEPTAELEAFRAMNHCGFADADPLVPDGEKLERFNMHDGAWALSCRHADFKSAN